MKVLRKTLQIIVSIILFIMGKVLLRGDFQAFLQWWIMIFILGLIFMPLTTILFSRFHDRGYLFSKTIGIAVTGYLMWLFSSLHIFKFTSVSCMISMGIGFILNILLLMINRKLTKKDEFGSSEKLFMKQWDAKFLNSLITEELLFFALFLFFTYIRGFKPEAYGTEKFMDYGFMTSMFRSEYMPPQDFWFSGTNLNYYYVGQFLATYLTKLSFVPVSHGYNLMLMMIAAFAYVLPYSMVYNLIQSFQKEEKKCSKIISHISGLLGGAAVCIAGNMHFPLFKWLEPAVRKFYGIEASTDPYFFPDSTRYIGYQPETTDKTIHEFPAYSFVLGDLHAHVLNILFVLTILGILLAWLMMRNKKREIAKQPLWKELVQPAILLVGFFIGLFHTTNFWDFPIYFVVSGAVILFSNLIVYNFKGKALWLTGLQGIIVLLISELVALPFTLSFDPIATTPRLAVAHTPIYQLIVLWGLPIYMIFAFLFILIDNHVNEQKGLAGHKKEPKSRIFRFMETLKPSDLFVITIGLCAFGLVLIPEILYIEDIYSGDYKRANTMFKLTYQAFIMFGISFGYLFPRLICFGRTKGQKKTAMRGFILFILTLFYIGNAVKSWYGNIFDLKGYKGIDATTFMERRMPEDKLAIDWLNENVSGMPVVLEANGDSYTDYQRVSVMTGLPTVLGWRTHEWLWKGDTILLDKRAEDIRLIYTSEDEALVKELLDKYDIAYIYVGKLECEKFLDINHEMIKELGTVVYESQNTKGPFETYIVEIDKE